MMEYEFFQVRMLSGRKPTIRNKLKSFITMKDHMFNPDIKY